jgi:glutaredoxin
MAERLAVLGFAALAGLVLYAVYLLWRRAGAEPLERLDVDELGLELMAGCCAFVVFTSPGCRPCAAALSVVGRAAERSPNEVEVTAVDALERPELTRRYDVRTVPTVFLITASGHVLARWKSVPDPAAVHAALELTR